MPVTPAASASSPAAAPLGAAGPGGLAEPGGAGGTVGGRVRSGLRWVSLSMVVARVTHLGTTVTLAWLLAREMFGLVALAMAAIHLLTGLREIGLGQAIIQRANRDPGDLLRAASTAFLLTMTINLVLFVPAFALAPWIAGFFPGTDGLDTILQVMLLGLLIGAFSSVPSVILQRNLEFGRLAASEASSAVLNAAVSIALAVWGWGVWSIVIGSLVSQGVFTVMLMRAARWWPRLEFDPGMASELFGFGKYMWGFSLVTSLGSVLDRFTLGRVLGVASLGEYNIAYNFCKMPATQLGSLVNRVAFPALARLQEDPPAMQRAFLRALSHMAVLALPIAFGLAAVADPFVVTAYGPKWSGAAPVMKVLAFYGMMLAVASVAGPVLMALGKPRVIFYTSIAHLTLLVPMLLILGRWGSVGIAWAILVPRLLSSIAAFWLIVRYLSLPLSRLLEPVVRAGACALAMYGLLMAFQGFVTTPAGLRPPLTLALTVPLGIAIYLVATRLCYPAMFHEFLGTMRQILWPRRALGGTRP